MDISFLFAKVFGLTYLIIGIGILTNKYRYRELGRRIVSSDVYLHQIGLISLIAGLFIVQFHNLWLAGWELIITLIGWCCVLKGAAILIAPASIENLAKFLLSKIELVGVLALSLGLLLTYFGFVSV